jgi:hypothetical protein
VPASELWNGLVEPLIGQVRVESSDSWIDTGLQDAGSLERDLRVLCLDDAEISSALDLRHETVATLLRIQERIDEIYRAAAYFDTPPEVRRLLHRRQSLLRRFRDRLTGRGFRVDDVARSEVRLPLFLLAAPTPEGCSATFSSTTMAGRALTWSVKLFGSGLGGSSTLWVTSTWRFRSAAGERKLVFVPMTVTSAAVTLLDGTQVVGTTTQVVASEVSTATAPGLLLLAPDADTALGRPIMRYPLADDGTGGLATYEHKYEGHRAGRIEIGVTAFGAQAPARSGDID